MNMLLHGVKDTEFDIFHDDTLLNEWDMNRTEAPRYSRRVEMDEITKNDFNLNISR
jgi:type I restriction enzyme M protein